MTYQCRLHPDGGELGNTCRCAICGDYLLASGEQHPDEETDQKIEALENENDRLREALSDAINFMKDAQRVSIASRAIQLEAEFFGES